MTNNPVVALFKLGERDHMAQLLNDGHVFMRPLLEFKNHENSPPRADPDEGSGYCRQATGAILRMEHEGEWLDVGELTGPIKVTDRNLLKTNIYCLHAPRRNDCGRVLELHRLAFGDSYVLILNADEFLRRLTQAITQAGHEPHCVLVEYVDKSTYTEPMGAFRNFSHYSDQKELRVAAMPGTGSPLSLYLGNLSDIAIMGQTTERLSCTP